MYHDIIVDGEEDACIIKIDRFKQQIEFFLNNGFDFVNVDDAIKLLDKKDAKFVSITFDDAFESVYTLVYPYLKEKNIPFIIFQSTSFIDKENYLSKKQIAEMLKSGLCTLGAHTVSHDMLSHLSVSEQEFEVKKGREILTEEFGVDVKYLAFPFGRVVSVGFKASRIASKYYSAAFMAYPMGINSHTRCKVYSLPRIVPGFNYYRF